MKLELRKCNNWLANYYILAPAPTVPFFNFYMKNVHRNRIISLPQHYKGDLYEHFYYITKT